MLIPSLLSFLVYGFVLGAVVWSLGLPIHPAALAALTTVVFLTAAGLGIRYREQEIWAEATDDLPQLRTRFFGHLVVMQMVARVLFSMPVVAFEAFMGLFPRRPEVDREVLVLATNLAAALDEVVPMRDLKARLAGEYTPEAVDEAVLLLEWAQAGRVVRRGGDLHLMPGSARDQLLVPLQEKKPTVVHLSVVL
jgi:hypothetical protein